MNKRQRKKQAKKYIRYLSAYATIIQAKIILSNIASLVSEAKLRKAGLWQEVGVIVGPGRTVLKEQPYPGEGAADVGGRCKCIIAPGIEMEVGK